MIKKIVRKIIKEFLQSGLIEPEEESLYTYGVELTVVSFFNSLWMIGLGIVLEYPLFGIIYVLILGSVRTQIGGYHSKSYLGCFICYNIFFGVSLLICSLLCRIHFDLFFISMIGITYLMIIYMFAPVSSLKKLNIQEKAAAKWKAIRRSVFWMAAALIFFNIDKYISYEIISVLGISIILMLSELLKKKIRYIKN